ncbi:MAG: YraN family protein [Bryobacterales bacterium]|nr:YraN family protein [Bryobacterales bacterium]
MGLLAWLWTGADQLRHRARLRSWNPEQAAGRRGEDLAHRFLQRAGMTVVARNYRTRAGTAELDLVAWDGGTLVFVEVKSRASEEFGPPDRAVDREKRAHIVRAAADYARRAGVELKQTRFDIVNVVFARRPRIEHLRDAFRVSRSA